jgi:glycosyltransferase involved in cell wall biosynthesis
MIAPPWLALPIEGYGGIELVVEGLIRGLEALDVEVELIANGARKMRGVKTHSLYKEELFDKLERPFYEALPILKAHMSFALNVIKEGDFDIIHNHDPDLGPQLLALATQNQGIPPALHTFHGPPFRSKAEVTEDAWETLTQYEQLKDMGRLWGVCISEALARPAPATLKKHMLPAVHNAIELDIFPYIPYKKNYFITLARFTPDKGQDIAAKLAAKMKARLRMAGTVAGIGSSRKLLLELSNPLSSYRNHPHFKYYSDKILPYTIRYPRITYSGNLSGSRKIKFIAEAKALLFPIQWEEPFGMSVIEALACGTPVIAMNRGAMPEIIEHGVNGFLANNEDEFYEYMQRVDEIDPAACRRSVEEKFSADTMAQAYLDRYNKVLKLNDKLTKK